jgi:hypothetical protein
MTLPGRSFLQEGLVLEYRFPLLAGLIPGLGFLQKGLACMRRFPTGRTSSWQVSYRKDRFLEQVSYKKGWFLQKELVSVAGFLYIRKALFPNCVSFTRHGFRSTFPT